MTEPFDLDAWCEAHATTQLWVSVDGVGTIERCFGDARPGDTTDVGSIQKNVICLTIAVLARRGEINIDHPMTTWLGRGWTRATAAQEQVVTLRHVMSMTTGLFEDLTFDTEPGRVWTYNNHAYHLVKKALVELTGQTTQELCDELVFGPLGMDDSTWRDRDGDVLSGDWPVSALHTSARDLVRFGEAMLDHGEAVAADPHLLAEATRTSQDLNPSWGLFWWDFSAPRAIVLGHRPDETSIPESRSEASRSTDGSHPMRRSTPTAASVSATIASTSYPAIERWWCDSADPPSSTASDHARSTSSCGADST